MCKGSTVQYQDFYVVRGGAAPRRCVVFFFFFFFWVSQGRLVMGGVGV
jgi:hypothetical protein